MTHPHRRRKRQAAFTLVELAVVLVVLGLVIAGLMSLLTQDVRRAKQAELEAKLDAIGTALLNFRRTYDRIPCPADSTALITTADFGVEGANPGSCTGGTPAANYTNGNTAGGVVPVRTLGLPDGDMFDPWGGRLTYAVDMRMTQTAPDPFTTYGPADTTIGSITVNDGSGTATPRTANAVVVIVSHGPNGHGAFQLSGVRRSSSSTNADELINCHCHVNGSYDSFSSTFVEEPAIALSTDVLNNYDDTVRYYVRSQLLSASEATAR